LLLWIPALVLLQSKRRSRLSLWQRLGFGPTREPAAPKCILFHAASAGDVRALVALIEGLRGRQPGWQLVLSVQTASGMAMAKRCLGELQCCAAPLDVSWCSSRFVRRLQPDFLVLEYLELWPSLLSSVHRSGARWALINGRIHPQKMARYQRLAAQLYRPMLSQCVFCTARSDGDAQRLAALGAPSPRSHVHTKHALHGASAQAPTAIPEQLEMLRTALGLNGIERDATCLIGSAHADERKLILGALVQALRHLPRLTCLWVPRYPQEGAAVAREARALGIATARLSRECPLTATGARLLLIETVGDLALLYHMAAVAVLGGSFGRRGGQNPVEPAVAGCLLLVGPNTVQVEPELEHLGPVVKRVRAAELGERLRASFEKRLFAQLPKLAADTLAQPARAAVVDLLAQLEQSVLGSGAATGTGAAR
jgi:3-deoxy-D-manno-octulosonic-acid transferase